jgi:hypothetical protein
MIGAGPGSATIPTVGAAEVHARGKVSIENSDFGWILGDFNRSEIHVGDNSAGQLEAGVIAISSIQGSTQPAIELYGPSIHASNALIESYGAFIQPGDPTEPQASRILLSGDLVELRNTGLGTDGLSDNGMGSAVEIRARELLGFGMSIGISTGFGATAPTVKLSAEHIALHGGAIFTDVFNTSERAGDVLITARNVELLDTIIGAQATSEALAPGNIRIIANRLYLAKSYLSSDSGTHESQLPDFVEQAAISIVAPSIVMVDGATITTETSGKLKAARIEFIPSANGRGNLSIAGDGTGEITSSAVARPFGEDGAAGDILVHADNITLSNVALVSTAKELTHGPAGTIALQASGAISILNNTRIATDTEGTGNAGNVTITAGSLLVDPSEISSKASATSSGQVGSINVKAQTGVTVMDGSRFSIENHAHIRDPSLIHPASLEVNAAQINLLGGQISARSTDNAPASNVRVTAGDQLIMRNAAILTTAKDGNGGAIEISGGRVLVLDHSQISTSVLGTDNGNGGDIGIVVPMLVMNTGFIQANTAAAHATGGNVFIGVETLISAGLLLLNASTSVPFDARLNGLSVIQAAAPDGVSGDVRVTAPLLDIVGNIRGLSAPIVDVGAISKDLCRIGAGSSLTPLGKGGLRPIASDLIRPELPVASAPGQARPRNELEPTVLRQQDVAQSAYRCEY